MSGSSAFLVTIDPVPDGNAFLDHVARVTRKPAADWARTLAAPGLARVLFSASSDAEARDLAARYAELGFGTHVVATDEVMAAIATPFEAAWVERARDGFICIGPLGEELELSPSDIRSLTTGRQVVQGQRQHFLVVGLRGSVGAIVMRFAGTDVSKLVRANGHEEELEGALAAFMRAAPHARVERGLDALAGKLPCLAFVGATDLAMAGVLSAALVRRFPPPPPKPLAPAQAHDDAAPAALPVGGRYPGEQPRGRFGQPPPAAAVSLDVDASSGAARPRTDAHVAIAALDAMAPPPDVTLPGSASSSGMGRRLLIGGVVALVVAVALVVMFKKPGDQQRVVKRGDTWQSAHGVSFTYAAPYDASISGIANPGFVIDVARGGDKSSLRVPSHEAKLARDAGGATWHVESWDMLGAASGGGADWIVIAVRPK